MYYRALRSRRETETTYNIMEWSSEPAGTGFCLLFWLALWTHFFASYPFPFKMLLKVMFADMTQGEKKSEKDSQTPPTPKTTCILSKPLFSYPQSNRDKAKQAAHIKDEKGAGGGGGGAWLMKHEKALAASDS